MPEKQISQYINYIEEWRDIVKNFDFWSEWPLDIWSSFQNYISNSRIFHFFVNHHCIAKIHYESIAFLICLLYCPRLSKFFQNKNFYFYFSNQFLDCTEMITKIVYRNITDEIGFNLRYYIWKDHQKWFRYHFFILLYLQMAKNLSHGRTFNENHQKAKEKYRVG